MKTQFFFIIFVCLIACKAVTVTKAKTEELTNTVIPEVTNDTVIIDTIAYLQTEFVDKKQNYIGTRLSFLLKNLKVDVKSYLLGVAHNNRHIIPDLTISFYSYDESNYRDLVLKQKTARLWIKWETPLSRDSASAIIMKTNNNKRVWGDAEKEYYGNQIIKDFGLVQWPK